MSEKISLDSSVVQKISSFIDYSVNIDMYL